jgi:tripartite-type tricarboxylate transporter receptor subunit TctC
MTLAGLAAMSAAAALQAQPFVPTRPVELVVHSAPGGGSDVLIEAMRSTLRSAGVATAR